MNFHDEDTHNTYMTTEWTTVPNSPNNYPSRWHYDVKSYRIMHFDTLGRMIMIEVETFGGATTTYCLDRKAGYMVSTRDTISNPGFYKVVVEDTKFRTEPLSFHFHNKDNALSFHIHLWRAIAH